MTDRATAAITHEYELRCSAEHTFEIYTGRIGEWWDPALHGDRRHARGGDDPRNALDLTPVAHTVHRHVANILRRLGQSSRAAAAAHATRAGLI